MLNGGVSYHSPIIVRKVVDIGRPKRSFKFCDMWFNHAEFLSILNSEWCKDYVGSNMFQLWNKLKVLRKSLMRFHRKHYSNVTKKVDKLRKLLKQVQNNVQLYPKNDELLEQERAVYNEYLITLKNENFLLK